MSVDLAQRMRELRTKRGLTTTALARPRYSVSYVSQIERGLRRPSRHAMQYFAARLGVTPEFLETGIPDDLPQRVRFEIEQAQRELAEDQPDGAEQRIRAALSTIDSYAMVGIRGKALLVLGEVLLRHGEYRTAVECFEQAQASPMLTSADEAAAISGLARGHRKLGHLKYASHVIESYLDSDHGPLPSGALSELYTVLVSVHFEQGDMLKAERAAERALGAVNDETPPRIQAYAWWDAARVLVERGAWDEALEYLGRARHLMDRLHNRRDTAKLHVSYAFLCLESEPIRFEEAREHLEKAEAALLEADAPADLAYVHTERSRLAILEEAFEEAVDYATMALEAADLEPLERARALFLQGRAYGGLGRRRQARTALRKALLIFEENGARQQQASCWRELGELSEAAGDRDRAFAEFYAGLQILDPRRSRA